MAVNDGDVAEAHQVGEQNRNRGRNPVEQRATFFQPGGALRQQISQRRVLRLELCHDLRPGRREELLVREIVVAA